jgi:hypothetical protein
MTKTNQWLSKISSERMKKNNPSTMPGIAAKQTATRRINGTLRPAVHGGNGTGPTKPELLLLTALGNAWENNLPIKTFPHCAKGERRHPGFPTCYKVDVGNRTLKIAIEIDGGSHRPLIKKQQDIKKEKKLTELEWKVLRFTNKEVMTNLSQVLLEIKREIKAL